MKNIIVILFVCVSSTLLAQQSGIVLHLQSKDTLVYKAVAHQVSTIKKEFPNVKVEVVCHGPGLEFLLKKNQVYSNEINKLGYKDVVLAGCEYSMKVRNYTKEDLVPFASTVPSGIIEIIKKEQEHWLYVKLGF
jgi:hypothetical protein